MNKLLESFNYGALAMLVFLYYMQFILIFFQIKDQQLIMILQNFILHGVNDKLIEDEPNYEPYESNTFNVNKYNTKSDDDIFKIRSMGRGILG